MYEAIVKGQNIQEPGIPESFKVLIKELQALNLNVELLDTKAKASKGADKSEKAAAKA